MTKPWKAKKALYRVAEAAEILSDCDDTIYTLMQIGELQWHNRTPGSKAMRITGVSIESYIERHLVPVEMFRECEFGCVDKARNEAETRTDYPWPTGDA